MKNFKKFLFIFFLLAVFLTFMPKNTMTAYAEATELPAAVNGVITLQEDVTLDQKKVTFPSATTLDLNGYTLTNNVNDAYAFQVVSGQDLTIIDSSQKKSGKIYAPKAWRGTILVGSNTSGGSVTFKSGCIEGIAHIFDTWDNSNITVTGGSMIVYDKYGSAAPGGMVYEVSSGCNIIISGGSFMTNTTSENYDPVRGNDGKISTEGTVSITGGTFIGSYTQRYVPGYSSDQSFSNNNPTITVGDYTVTRDQVSNPLGSAPYNVYVYTVEPAANYVAQIGEAKYETLAAAIAAVPTDGTATTIEMIADTTLGDGVTVASGKNIVLELGGHVITETLSKSGTSALITNNGTLTIQDSSDTKKDGTGNGKISYQNANPDQSSIPGYASNTIINQGTLTIESGYLENTTTGGYAAYTVDNLTNGGSYTPVFTMNGGKLYNSYTDAVRMFLNSDSKLNKVVINGGILNSDKASGRVIVVHNPNAKVNKGELDITGGTINGKVNAWSAANDGGVEDRFSDAQYGGISINISGGCINELSFTEMANKTLRAGALSVTGGVYNVSPDAYVSSGYKVVDNTDEATRDAFPYRVVKAETYVAQIGETKYATLAAAIKAAGTDVTTIDLIDNAVGDVTVESGQNITLNLNGYNVVGAEHAITNNGTLIIADSSDKGCLYTTDISAQGRAAVLNNEGGTLTITGGWFGDSDNVKDNANGVQRGNAVRNWGTATISGGHYTACDNFTNNGYAYAIGTGGTNKNGSMTINNADVYGKMNGGIAADSGTLVINGGSFVLTSNQNYRAVWITNDGGNTNVTINGGTFVGKVAAVGASIDDNKQDSSDVAISIKGGYFSALDNTAPVNVSKKNSQYNWTTQITGGVFAKKPTDSYVTSGYEAVALNADNNYGGEKDTYANWYKVGKVKATDISEAATPAQSYDKTYTAGKIVTTTDGENVELESKDTVTINLKVTDTDVTSTNELSQYDVQSVIESAMSVVPDATSLNVNIQVVSDGGSAGGTPTEPTFTYEVHPIATVTTSTGGTTTTEEFVLTNDKLASDATFTIKLLVPEGLRSESEKVKVTHKLSDGGTVVYPELAYDSNNIITIADVTEFSEFELEKATGSSTTGFDYTFTLSLKNKIEVPMYLYNVQGDINKYTVTYSYKDPYGVTQENTVDLKDYAVESAPGWYRIVVASFSARQMTDEVTVKVKYDGTQVGENITKSIQSYCADRIAYSNNNDLKELCKATLDYGAAAQYNFNYNTTDLATKGNNNQYYNTKLADTKIGSQYDHTLSTDFFETAVTTLSLKAQTQINFYFKEKSGDTSEYTFRVGGNQVVPTVKDGYYIVSVKDIAAKNLDSQVTVTVNKVNTDEVEEHSASVLNYTYLKQNASNSKLATVCKALYCYWSAANGYFNN